ncbi:MAG TPA: phosphate ABC transporter permease subunit PstC [Candidatus Glassbacteria bacterium]|nr:phosphate ABC transporter permease subunit PstC [Candidatus Glassbacteria bacterium]
MILSMRNSSYHWNLDRALVLPLCFAALGCVSILVLILAFLAQEAWPVLTNGGWKAFIMDQGWYPLEGLFGLMPMLWASLAVMLGAVLLAGPLGLGCAIFISFYARGILQRSFRLLLSLLSGLPSVVLGLWGLTVLVPLITQWRPPGASLFAAMLVLALMILPTVALTSAAALSGVPAELLAGAAALGLRRRAQVLGVAVPAARSRIGSGLLLAMARALGETMAVLMVAGNVVQYPRSLFEPVRVLTANIALEMAYASGAHRAGLFASGLLLTLVVLLLAWLAARMGGNVYDG